ncbi:MAG: dihydrodipicolinate synthase family protein [Dehalococcoidia bacterium]|nr:MAG: dihydrodipicolinate synthase family protein [Dehalococcoidia bacterium]
MSEFQGVFPAMVTPLNENLEIDEKGLRAEVDYLIGNHVHGLVALGSSGEFPYITADEKKRVIDIVVEQANGRVPVVVCTSSTGTDEVILLSRYAQEKGADAVMINLPLYYPLTEDDVFNHYQAISKAVDLPILLYDFPHLTHLNMSLELISRLSYLDNVIGIKETGPVEKAEEIIRIQKKEPFNVFTGISFVFLQHLQNGGAGVICLIPCVAPKEVVSIYESYKSGDPEKASQSQGKILPLVSMVAVPVQPLMVKEAMRQLGLPIQPYVKNPLPQITEPQKEIVRKSLIDMALIKG